MIKQFRNTTEMEPKKVKVCKNTQHCYSKVSFVRICKYLYGEEYVNESSIGKNRTICTRWTYSLNYSLQSWMFSHLLKVLYGFYLNQFRRHKPSLHIATPNVSLSEKRIKSDWTFSLFCLVEKSEKLLIGAQFSLATNKGLVTWCNFSCNLPRNCTLKRCKLVTNVWYVKNILANCNRKQHVFANFGSPRSRIALQVARKIAPCDRGLYH